MRPIFLTAAAALMSSASTLAAGEAPRVVTDIAPVHGLVARVMQGVGTPELIVDPGASPHGYSLRPSQARALSEADAVFWVGHELAPWLEGPLEELAGKAHQMELLEAPGTLELAFREGATFAEHDHDHGDHDDHEGHDDHDDHDDHGHDDHDDHADEEHGHDDHGHDDHDDHADEEHGHDDHDDHAHEEHGHDDHDDHAHEEHGHDDHGHDDHDDHGHGAHGEVDPHAWLAPTNGKAWLAAIAEELSEIDPANAEIYTSNALAGQAEIDETVASLKAVLEPVHDKRFIVFHDAYQYFEQAFDMEAVGSISLGDASDPSAARVAEVRDAVKDFNVVCVFSEPQFNAGLVDAVMEGSAAKTVVIDPLGFDITPGADFYTNMLTGLGTKIAGCLSQ